MSSRRTGRAETKSETTVWITGNQLTPAMSALEGLPPSRCVVLMIESLERSRQLPHHKQKLVLVWSAMRHFARELRALGYRVDYHEQAPDFETGLRRHMSAYGSRLVRLMESAEHGADQGMARMARALGANVEMTSNNMFLSNRTEFRKHAPDGKALRMELFYRRMRRQTGLLMANGAPEGGTWNYDAENRATPAAHQVFPAVPRTPPDEVTRAVSRIVAREFPRHFGELDGFAWPVTRKGAREFFEDFLIHRLDLFGPFEDAMVAGQRVLYHSLISPLLNIGLLDPTEVVRRAEERYRQGQARLNSVEGFIRQVIGWREFVYQVYHRQMPGYEKSNALGAGLPLPDFYWSGETEMACCRDAVNAVRRSGINHHIQRLMVTGNFALLAGIDPQAVNEWYWLAYVDAYHWVVTPNVLGMALYADGGTFATKPYAASASYIHRMSDYCPGCSYDHRKREGSDSCPFNALYWDFLVRNRALLEKNPRMNLMIGALKKRPAQEMREIRKRASEIRAILRSGGPL